MLIDNKNRRLHEELKSHIRSGDSLYIMNPSLTLFAISHLQKELVRLKECKILLSAPLVRPDGTIPLVEHDDDIPARNSLQQMDIAKNLFELVQQKIELCVLKEGRQAPSCIYLIKKKQGQSIVIQGNSAFTTAGLGLSASRNIDTNVLIQDPQTVEQFQRLFLDYWNNKSEVLDQKQELLQQLQRVARKKHPQEVYLYTLGHLFGSFSKDMEREMDLSSRSGFLQTKIWGKLYPFQKDGVLGAIGKLETYNGCIIADSVGLGKTFEALAVIKYYELRNSRVLVLSPKKLRENWLTYVINDRRNILAEDRFNYDVLNHTDLTRANGLSGDINLETLIWSNYDLVVIDESHNFRNTGSSKSSVSRYSRLMDDIIRKGVKTKVLMLSATPVNNRLNDLKNQIAFITEGNDSAFFNEGIPSYEATLRLAQKQFNSWLKQNADERKVEELLKQLRFDYFKLLDLLTIARSRKHIQKYYSMKEIGTFPERLPPLSIRAAFDELGEMPGVTELDKTIRRLSLAPYAPLQYVLPHKREEYDKKYDIEISETTRFIHRDRESSLIHLMRVNLLKRMESSIHSFRETLYKLLIKVEDFIEKLDAHQQGDLDCPPIEEVDIESEEYADMLLGSDKIKVKIEDCDRIRWRQDLVRDRELLTDLLNKSELVSPHRDFKLLELKRVIQEKIANPINPENRKVLIFTAFSDTAEYLYKHLSIWARENFHIHSALVTGSSDSKTTLPLRRKDLSGIISNFSPISKERDRVSDSVPGDIDILIATDCISEGQNLQDCDMVVNYDIHWNPVRLIQRFGRIDRLGSRNGAIQLVNFWPDMELDEYINLEARVSGRMVLLDVSATGEENLIDTSNDPAYMNDLMYRKKQLQQLQTRVVDLEDISGTISITDLNLNDFRMDLATYKEKNKPPLDCVKGDFTLVKRKESEEGIPGPGTLFCLRRSDGTESDDPSHPLAPFYLVYMADQGSLYYSHLETRKSLQLLRGLCGQETHIIEGEPLDVSAATQSLKEAVQSIVGKDEEQGLDGLFDSESEGLTGSGLTAEGFECITWFRVL